MKSLSWTIMVVLAIGWSCDVQCRSIDASTSSTVPPTPIVETQEKAASDKLVDVAAEILTVKVIGEAVDKTFESEVQREATAKEQAIAQIMKLAETKAIKEILADASTTTPTILNQASQATESSLAVASKILTAKALGDALDKSLESQVQAEANAKEQAIAQVMKLAETEAIKGILNDALKQPTNLRPPPPTRNLNIPPPNLEFESGFGDSDNEISGTRDKRTIATISRYATCLFTILVNPNCFSEIRNSGGSGSGARAGGLFAGLLGGGGGRAASSSRSSSRQEAYNRQLRQWMEYQKRQIAKLNATEGGNYTTPFPILPPSPPPPSDDEETTQRPQGFIGRFIQWKLTTIPNIFRTIRSLFSSILPFLQNLGGNRGGGGGGGLGALFGGGGSSGGSSGGFGNNYGSSSSSSSLSGGSSSSGSGISDSSSSGSGSSSGSAAETSTYRISLG